MAHIEQHNSLLDEATGWIARLRSDAVTSEDKHRFANWINTSQSHQEAFDKVMGTWEILGAAAYLPVTEQTLDAMDKDAKPAKRWFEGFSFMQGGMVAAGVTAIFAVLTLLPGAPMNTTSPELYQTAIGEQKRVTLSDGSVVDLNTNSRLAVTYSAEQRNLTLLQGEAFFDVASNKSRPFTVTIDGSTVTAVGTAFNIYRQSETDVSIAVTEGIVKVAERPDAALPTPNSLLVEAEQSINLDHRGLGELSRLNPRTATAWRSKTLVFEQAPLPQAIKQLNRYLKHPVDASRQPLNQLSVSGTFSVEAPDETLDAIVASFDLDVIETEPGQRYLSPSK